FHNRRELSIKNANNDLKKDYLTPFLDSLVPRVVPWRALNLGFVLQIT
ncbi:MAG: hypothetical protein ACI9E1_002381, partial [Cryomorphaceae bacterium]